VTTAQDAAVLYFALHGTDAPLTCKHLSPDSGVEISVFGPTPPAECGATLVGLSHDDGAGLCAEHVKAENGHLLSEETLAELWLVKRTLRAIKVGYPLSGLERFALKVADMLPTGEDDPNEADISHPDTVRAPPPEWDGKPHEFAWAGRWRDIQGEKRRVCEVCLHSRHDPAHRNTDEARIRGHIR
jgi:hypothetical protein